MNKQELAEQILRKHIHIDDTTDGYIVTAVNEIELEKGLIAAIVEAMDAPAKEGIKWVKASERLPEAYKVVACKVLYEDNSPRQDWELKWGYVNKESKWETIGNPVAIKWLDESAPAKAGIKWVKASEPPEPDRRVLMKYNDGQRLEFGCYVKNVWTGNKFGYLDEQDEQPSQCYPDYWIYPEWLDESAPNKVEATGDISFVPCTASEAEKKITISKEVEAISDSEPLFLYDTINHCSMEEFSSIKELEEYVLECFTDASDGVHPDIESLDIYKKVGGVIVEETGKTTIMNKEEVPVVKVKVLVKEAAKEAISVPAQQGVEEEFKRYMSHAYFIGAIDGIGQRSGEEAFNA